MRSVALKYIMLLMSVVMFFTTLAAQQKNITKAAKKKEQVERSYKKAYARARKSTIRHRYEIQTRSTREMMDAADKRAKAYNRQNDPTFLERIFKRKRSKCR
jgi:Cu/Ag efflux protein CusF